jgi:hypothetical protein
MQFTASAELHEKLERLRALMRTQIPDSDLNAIIEAAVTEKLERLETRRFAATSHPRKTLSKTDTSPTSRHIPAAVRRAVRERDGDRCVYVDASGRRCSERHRLEYHHRRPFGMGGDHRPSPWDSCARHNDHLAGRLQTGSDGSVQTIRITGSGEVRPTSRRMDPRTGARRRAATLGEASRVRTHPRQNNLQTPLTADDERLDVR